MPFERSSCNRRSWLGTDWFRSGEFFKRRPCLLSASGSVYLPRVRSDVLLLLRSMPDVLRLLRSAYKITVAALDCSLPAAIRSTATFRLRLKNGPMPAHGSADV